MCESYLDLSGLVWNSDVVRMSEFYFTQKVDDADVLRLVRTIDGKETIPMKKVIKNSLRAIGVDKVVKSLMSK